MFASCFPTKIGTMAIAWNADGQITGIQLPEENTAALLETLQAKLKAQQLSISKKLPPAVKAIMVKIQRHLAGDPQIFTLDEFALENLGPFFQKIYRAAAKLPAGKVVSYAALAKKAGNEKAARSVGSAMARNPFPIVVPCHRIVGSGKNFGGFSAFGGLATKRNILAIEGVTSLGQTY